MDMPEYKDTVSLIPYGLPQLLDFEATPDKLRNVKMTFTEKQSEDGRQFTLCELGYDSEDGSLLDVDGESPFNDENYYDLRVDRHLEPWLDKWLPIPFLRQSGDFYADGLPRFRSGPTNWARAYVTRVPSAKDPDKKNWRVVLAFDMQVEEPQNQKHAALSPDDVTARAVCSLADRERDNSWMLNEGWVNQWLQSVWDEYFLEKENKKNMPRMVDGETEIHLGYLASYLLYLRMLQSAIDHLNVRIVNLAGTQDSAAESAAGDTVDVDLVLDIGNSRSTGILVENKLNNTTDLNDSYRLHLRDLSQPEKFYAEPFETRIEFSRVDFGSPAFSKRSGRRSNAFTWASPVRTGPEASRLGNVSSNAEGTSGMSSPKRYLWDDNESSNLWYFTRKTASDREELVSSHSICRYLNNMGTPVACIRELTSKGQDRPKPGYVTKIFKYTMENCAKQDALPANQPRFSRSSMMMFLFMELIQQALVTINSPAQRYKRNYPDIPRRLRSVIFTVPPGMPFAEQRIYRRWAQAAISVLWDILGWKKNFYTNPDNKGKIPESNKSRDFRSNPEVSCSWDEATCTQLVYLYNEINRNYQGDAHLFFEIMGRIRDVPSENDVSKTEKKPTLRIATIDIGGGTTDLSITTYVLANDKSSSNRIWPSQDIRDGFNLGGDDILRSIVSDIVLMAIADNLVKQGVSQKNAEEAIQEMFGKKSDNMRIQNLRIKFLRQIAMPLAYEILERYEKIPLQDINAEITIPVGSLFRPTEDGRIRAAYPEPLANVVEFFNETLRERLGVSVDIMNLELNIRCKDVDNTINNRVRGVLGGMAEVINAYECDVLLLTGRPSRWNSIVRHVFGLMAVAPDRVITMHSYLIGPWYPFANASGTITDPKTTVVTGAILCTLAQNRIEGFAFNSNRLKLQSTARFVGELDINGSLPREKVWFPNLNPDKSLDEDEYTKVVQFSSPITIGFRQLEVPRWTAQRCWSMDFASEADRKAAEGHTPYYVRVRFKPGDDESDSRVPEADQEIGAKPDMPNILYDDGEAVLMGELVDGKLEKKEVKGARPVVINLRTLAKMDEEGCWMDTGILFNK